MKMFQVDAFSQRLFAGNPAAVLVLRDWLDEPLMQAIAGENHLPETVFVCAVGTGWALRWFTPLCEVAFCGHATLAAAHVLSSEYGQSLPLDFATRIGRIRVEGAANGYVLALPRLPPEPLSELPAALSGLFNEACAPAFRNFENLFVELPDETAVRGFRPDLYRLSQLGPIGLAITARGCRYDFVSRYFAPGSGIPEDPVTGSIHATLVPYWAQRLGKTRLTAYQASARGGVLECELSGAEVLIQGQAVTFFEADLRLALPDGCALDLPPFAGRAQASS